MIVKITRGGSAPGLMRYLVGEGRANEHTSPHLVAGSAGSMAWYSVDELSKVDASRIGKMLEEPRRVSGTEVTVPVKSFDETAGVLVASGERRAAHVWHCSLSMPPTTATGEPSTPLEDETWGQIAGEFVDAMGFSEASGRSGCRWVAVHHGLSVNGGDHIHLAVQLVREDGTKASTHNDYKTASRAVGELETTYGLEVVSGRVVGRSARAEIRGEVEQAARTGMGETYSRRLGRTVRACAVSSASEDEFVRRCRGEGLWVRPRFAAGSQDVVTGFSVAEQPAVGERAVWKAAGHLGRDLTLPRLRESWPDDAEHAQAGAVEWQAAWRGKPISTGEGRETSVPPDRLWQTYSNDVARLVDQLRGLDPSDHATWARVARETSGVLAAWSLRTEATPGPLAEASDQLAHGAALHAREVVQAGRPRRGRPVSLRGSAFLLMQLAANPSSAVGQALLVIQVANVVRALHAARAATGQARQATQLANEVRARLVSIAQALPHEPSRQFRVAANTAAADRRAPMGRPYADLISSRAGRDRPVRGGADGARQAGARASGGQER